MDGPRSDGGRALAPRWPGLGPTVADADSRAIARRVEEVGGGGGEVVASRTDFPIKALESDLFDLEMN